MVAWLWAALGVLGVTVIALSIKLLLLRRSADEIRRAFGQRLSEDTNTLIDISSRDKRMTALAKEINVQLRQLRKARQSYQQGDGELKMAITNISHDLRTPLTAIGGYLDLLECEDKSDEAKRYLEIIRERAETLKAMTEELFRYSVIASSNGQLNLTSVDLKAALEQAAAGFYTALTGKGITPEITLPEGPVIRRLDREAIGRVLENLLSNALKYSEGDLIIELTDAGEITFSNKAPGLDAVTAGRLFERFYTVESGRSSTGLGLSIAKALTEKMGGEILASFNQGRLEIKLSFKEN